MTSDDEDALLWQDAVFIAKTNEKVTVSLLQRRLRIGYTKSVRLIEKMVETGLVEKSIENSFTWNLIVK
jgi:S-DNA-T family DNA segregation ATPase FtsK/SpoIIIE